MMKLVTIHDLKVGNEYYLLSEDNHSIVIDYEHLKSFHKVEYRGTMKIREMRGGIIHVNHSFEFINLITNSIVHMQDFDIEQRIFVDIHDILNYLVMRLDKLNENNSEKKMSSIGNKQDYSQIKLDSLVYIKKLGTGQFGSVYLVRDK